MCNLLARHRHKDTDITLVSLRITGLVVFVLGTGLWLGENYPNLAFSCYTLWGAGLFVVLLSFWEPSPVVLGIISFACLAGGALSWDAPALRDVLTGFASGAFGGLWIQKKYHN